MSTRLKVIRWKAQERNRPEWEQPLSGPLPLRPLRWASLVLAMAATAAGFALQSLWSLVLASFLAGLTWAFAQRIRWGWLSVTAFLLLFAGAVSGIWFVPTPLLPLVALLAALNTWDLESFARRLEYPPRVDDRAQLVRQHLRRLLLLDGLGLSLAIAALAVRIEFGLGLAFLLGLLAVAGLAQGFRIMKNRG